MSLGFLKGSQLVITLLLGCAFTGIAQEKEEGEEKRSPDFFPAMKGFNLVSIKEIDGNISSETKAEKSAAVTRNYVYRFSGKKNMKAPSREQLSEYYSGALKKAPGRKTACHKNVTGKEPFAGGYVYKGKEMWISVSGMELNRDSAVTSYSLQLTENPETGYINAASMDKTIKKDGKVALDIHFESGQAIILEESMSQVYELVTMLRNDPALKVSIEGHTDKMGSAVQNKELSESRANAVKDIVIRKGIDPVRVSSVGWGWSKPLSDNSTELGRAKNRRIEIVKK